MNLKWIPLVVCLLGAALAPAGVSAGEPQQTATGSTETKQPKAETATPPQGRRPYRGLFGAPAGPDSKQSLDVTGSLFGAYDEDAFTRGAETGRVTRSGGYGGMNAGARYNRPGERLSLGLGGDVAVNRYSSRYTSRRTTSMYLVDGSVTWTLTSRTTLSGSSLFTYAPEYRLSLFVSPATPTGVPDVFNTVAPDYDLFRSSAYRTSTILRLSQALGQHTSVEGWYALTAVNYDNGAYDYRSRAAGVRLSQRITRNAGFHLGYSYSTPSYGAAFSDVDGTRLHNIDAGVDYSRSLSLSRRTRFSFWTGSVVVVADQTSFGGAQSRSFRFVGGANLTREIGRTWNAQVAYRRNVDLREGFSAPFLADGVSASIGGLFSRRVRFSSSTDFSFGTVGIGTSNKFHAYTINSGLEVALSRVLATFVRYVYYTYDFDAQVALDPRFAKTFERQGARVGLMASFPLVR